MSRPQRLCAYCSQPGTTKEHFWGKWSKKYLPHVTPRTTHYVSQNSRGPSGEVVSASGKGALDRPGDIRAQTLKVVCEDCNTRWMKAVNERAEPSLGRLAKGDWWGMSGPERAAVAAWC